MMEGYPINNDKIYYSIQNKTHLKYVKLNKNTYINK